MRCDQRFTIRAPLCSNSSEQQAKVFVNLSGRCHRRPGVGIAMVLADSNRRRDPVDSINIRSWQLIQVLPRPSGKAFDVATLAFGVQCVERETAFPGTADTSHDRQLPQRDADIDILEIMNAYPTRFDVFGHGSELRPRHRQSGPPCLRREVRRSTAVATAS